MPTATAKRQLFDVGLEPIAGSRFQPTGFPDLGPAEFKRPVRLDGEVEWRDALLVESAQSMANHLEGAGWDYATQQPVDTLAGLPYVRVLAADDSRYLTSSRTEAHRLASAFVKQAKLGDEEMTAVIRERLDLRDDTPLAPRDIAAAVFALDPMCLLHGVFFAESAKVWPGQPKIARAVTGFIEAVDVSRALSGGVKQDAVRHGMNDEKEGTSREGYGTIPFHRTEFTAGSITAYFVIDLAQIASYGLPAPATALLEAIARWEIRSLLDGGLRLRTACDLVPVDGSIADRSGEVLATLDDLDGEIRRLVGECRQLVGSGEPLEVFWGGGKARAKK
ncbi:MAG: type I-G CRISPR-associated RAMP protein Csb1/Cas7g [Acidimicrobiales bacterium]